MCGVARSCMSRIERGGANPSLDAIEVLADALKVPPASLFVLDPPSTPTHPKVPVLVPFAADGSCFNPSLKRLRTGNFTVGAKGVLQSFDNFEDALNYLRAMPKAYWLRPTSLGNWGIVKIGKT